MNNQSFFRRKVSFMIFFVFFTSLFNLARAQEVAISLEIAFENFKAARKAPCGKRAEAVRVGKTIIERFVHDELNQHVIEYVKKQISQLEKEEQACKSTGGTLAELFENFKTQRKLPCGKREKALETGSKILYYYGDDESNKAVIEYVGNQIPLINKEDLKCQRYQQFNSSYKEKRWSEFFAVSRVILMEEGESPLALEIMITLASTGYDLATVHKIDTFNAETVYYAKLAIEKIESGILPKTRWGVFNSYKSRDHTLGWLNYIAGYISNFYLNDKKESLKYFYQASRCDCGISFEATVYHAAAIYYFNQGARLASRSSINDFTREANNLIADSSANPDLSLEWSAEQKANVRLYQKMAEMYKARYVLEPSENVFTFEDYIEKLLNRPLPEPKFDDQNKRAAVEK